MALNEIQKGMSNAAEAINQNFENVGVVDSGSNSDGYYVEFQDGTVLSFGSKEFIDSAGWGVGKSQNFNQTNMPTAYKKPMITIYSSYNSELYDGSSAFVDIQTSVSKINANAGNVVITKHSGNVSNTTKLTIRYLHIGKKITS